MKPAGTVQVGDSELRRPAVLGTGQPLVVMAGPCALESRSHALEVSAALAEMTGKRGISLIYKTSFDKANRTSVKSKRGIGLKKALPIFSEIRETTGCPVMTDVHNPEQCESAAPHVDMLQIPAFLCRQTDLLLAAGQTGKAINVKKGQFLAPGDMVHVAEKIASTGNRRITLCERGTSFGYHNLVADMRSLVVMREIGYPVVMDATHAVQSPGGAGGASGGDRRLAPYLARAAVAIGVAAVFIETHPDPDKAPSDGPNMLYLKDMPALLDCLLAFDTVAKRHP